jgi:hypothetical protein
MLVGEKNKTKTSVASRTTPEVWGAFHGLPRISLGLRWGSTNSRAPPPMLGGLPPTIGGFPPRIGGQPQGSVGFHRWSVVGPHSTVDIPKNRWNPSKHSLNCFYICPMPISPSAMFLRILTLSLLCAPFSGLGQNPVMPPCHTVNSTLKDSTISRIAFGSCAKQSKNMPVLLSAKAAKPDVFIWLGDNVYGDTDDMTVMRAKYNELSCRPEFKALNSTVPFLATWDDHDYGQDDMGKEYRFKEASKVEFMQFWNEPKDSERFTAMGIYHSQTVGPVGKGSIYYARYPHFSRCYFARTRQRHQARLSPAHRHHPNHVG